MKQISMEELKEILKLHELWLYTNGREGIKANLFNADLKNANLSYADLRYTDLKNADLSYVDLRNADLTNANLKNADLRYTNLRYTDLKNADLCNVDLSNADLCNANLYGTDLYNANLSNANLRRANLYNANLYRANLSNVKINIGTNGYHLACPEEGSFIGWKKAGECLVKLQILEDAKRSSATTLKCRCNKAKVLDIINIETEEHIQEVVSDWNDKFIYKVGEIVFVDDFDECRWNECSTGIHFFMNKECALNY